MSYRNILVAVDTTDEAGQVITAACEFAEGKNATISIVTVVRPFADYYGTFYTPIDDSRSTHIEEEAVEQARASIADLARPHNIDADAISVIVGKPSVEIRRLANKLGADLIVMGTHGRRGLGLMLGSTANAVLHGTQCDVLAVKVRAEEPQ